MLDPVHNYLHFIFDVAAVVSTVAVLGVLIERDVCNASFHDGFENNLEGRSKFRRKIRVVFVASSSDHVDVFSRMVSILILLQPLVLFDFIA